MDSGRPVPRTMRLKLLDSIGGFDEASGACDGLAHWVRLVNVEMMVNQSVVERWLRSGTDEGGERESVEVFCQTLSLQKRAENYLKNYIIRVSRLKLVTS